MEGFSPISSQLNYANGSTSHTKIDGHLGPKSQPFARSKQSLKFIVVPKTPKSKIACCHAAGSTGLQRLDPMHIFHRDIFFGIYIYIYCFNRMYHIYKILYRHTFISICFVLFILFHVLFHLFSRKNLQFLASARPHRGLILWSDSLGDSFAWRPIEAMDRDWKPCIQHGPTRYENWKHEDENMRMTHNVIERSKK